MRENSNCIRKNVLVGRKLCRPEECKCWRPTSSPLTDSLLDLNKNGNRLYFSCSSIATIATGFDCLTALLIMQFSFIISISGRVRWFASRWSREPTCQAFTRETYHFNIFFLLAACFDASSMIEKICSRDKEILERLDKDYNYIFFY